MSVTSRIKIVVYSKNDNHSTFYGLIMSLLSLGWTFENERGEKTFLPIGDIDDFEWKSEKIDTDSLLEIFRTKLNKNEHIGFELRKLPDNTGGDFLYYLDNTLVISLSINRKVLKNGFTNINWYINEFYTAINGAGCEVESIFFDEHV